MTSRSAADRRRCQRALPVVRSEGLEREEVAAPLSGAADRRPGDVGDVDRPEPDLVGRRAARLRVRLVQHRQRLVPESTNRADPRARSRSAALGWSRRERRPPLRRSRRPPSGRRRRSRTRRAGRRVAAVGSSDRFVGHRRHLRPAIRFASRRRAAQAASASTRRAALAISPDRGPSASATRKNSVSTSTIDAPDARLR